MVPVFPAESEVGDVAVVSDVGVLPEAEVHEASSEKLELINTAAIFHRPGVVDFIIETTKGTDGSRIGVTSICVLFGLSLVDEILIKGREIGESLASVCVVLSLGVPLCTEVSIELILDIILGHLLDLAGSCVSCKH